MSGRVCDTLIYESIWLQLCTCDLPCIMFKQFLDVSYVPRRSSGLVRKDYLFVMIN